MHTPVLPASYGSPALTFPSSPETGSLPSTGLFVWSPQIAFEATLVTPATAFEMVSIVK